MINRRFKMMLMMMIVILILGRKTQHLKMKTFILTLSLMILKQLPPQTLTISRATPTSSMMTNCLHHHVAADPVVVRVTLHLILWHHPTPHPPPGSHHQRHLHPSDTRGRSSATTERGSDNRMWAEHSLTWGSCCRVILLTRNSARVRYWSCPSGGWMILILRILNT